MNLIATHPDGNGGAFVDKYNETIEMGLALRALSGIRDRGNVLGVDISDYLIVNNKGKNTVLVSEEEWKNIEETLSLSNIPGYVDDIKKISAEENWRVAEEYVSYGEWK
mgnify:CR=1 FL=1